MTQDARVVQTLAFKQTQVAIGRDPGMDIALPSSEVSRMHCWIDIGPGGAFIQDAESKNGTRLNGRAITRSALTTGDNVEIGEFKLWFQVVANPVDFAERVAAFADGATIEAPEAKDDARRK